MLNAFLDYFQSIINQTIYAFQFLVSCLLYCSLAIFITHTIHFSLPFLFKSRTSHLFIVICCVETSAMCIRCVHICASSISPMWCTNTANQPKPNQVESSKFDTSKLSWSIALPSKSNIICTYVYGHVRKNSISHLKTTLKCYTIV